VVDRNGRKKKKKEDNGTLPRLYKDIIRERDSQSVHFRQSRRRNKKIYMCRNVSLLIILYFAFYLYDIFHNVNSERYKAMQTLQNIKAQDELFLQTNSTANTTGTANNDNNSTAVNAVIPHDLASMEPIVVTERSQFVSKAVLVDPSKLKRIRKYNPDGSHQTQNITHMVTPDYSNMMITVSKNTAYFTNKSAAALELALGAATVEEEENTATLEENTVTLDLTTITTVTTTAETDTSESTEGAAVSVGLKPLS